MHVTGEVWSPVARRLLSDGGSDQGLGHDDVGAILNAVIACAGVDSVEALCSRPLAWGARRSDAGGGLGGLPSAVECGARAYDRQLLDTHLRHQRRLRDGLEVWGDREGGDQCLLSGRHHPLRKHPV
jgi:hypothetical protein